MLKWPDSVSYFADNIKGNPTTMYINKNINIDRIFEKGYSSKKDDTSNQKHGLGLWEIKKYLEKNTNLDLYTTKNDEFFTQQFEIYN